MGLREGLGDVQENINNKVSRKDEENEERKGQRKEERGQRKEIWDIMNGRSQLVNLLI